MIKKLRQKFVIVTMLLMTVTFGALFISDNLYTKYWDEQETLEKLEWYAESDSFFDIQILEDDESDEYNFPIFAITLDKNLNIQEILSSAKVDSRAPSEKDIQAIFSQPAGKYKWKSYIYTISDRPEGYLLVLTNTKARFYRTIGNILLICGGFGILFITSLFLSRFVTEPAQNALSREKQFISDASHELKTPLAAISINAQALQDELPDNKYLQYILSETNRMDELIRKLLKLSYLDEAGDNIEKVPFSLSQCCEEMVLSMESNIFERGIKFDYEICENIDYIGNEADIKQVLAILIDNAIKHTPELGTISVTLSLQGTSPRIIVKNTGESIPSEILPHIFDRFYRSDKSRTNDSNSYGLGLSIAKAIVDAHGGSITASNDNGGGVLFTIWL